MQAWVRKEIFNFCIFRGTLHFVWLEISWLLKKKHLLKFACIILCQMILVFYCHSLVSLLQLNYRYHHFVELMVNQVFHTYFLFLQKSSLPCDNQYILFVWWHAHKEAMHIVWINRCQCARHKTSLVYRIFVELPYRAYSGLPFNTVRRSSTLLPNFITKSKIKNCNVSWCNCTQKIVSVAKPYYSTTGCALCLCRNTEARSCNRCSSGRAISITYFECVCVCVCVCVNIVLKYAMRKCHIVMYSLSHSTIFFHVIS